ncbi:MAG: lamin tail domain-containing protein [Chloroflexia bacterium]|nr:lamin tail domain-containing protein [Chloroflexia bacterium]
MGLARRLAALLLLVVLLASLGGLQVRAYPVEIAPERPRANPGDVVISEVAWAGTSGSTHDEWIELYNTTASAIDLSGWTLAAQDGTPSINLEGTIPAYGYFLLERGEDDHAIVDIPADQTYTGALQNNPDAETLELRDDSSTLIDTANGNSGEWPAGDNTQKLSMERVDPWGPDDDANWASNDTVIRNGRDVRGNPVNGTPKLRNSASAPAADLWVRKAGPAQVVVGADVHYTLTLGNWGNLPAGQAVLSDTLPAGVTFAGQDSPYPFSRPDPGTLVWEVGTLPFSLTAWPILVTGSVAPTASGTLTNLLQGSTAVTEVSTANNAAQAETLVQQLYPDLAVAKAGPAALEPGGAIAYTLTVQNLGHLEAPAVWLSDTLPAGVAALSSSRPFSQTAPGLLHWELGPLPIGAQETILLFGQVLSSAAGRLTNTVTAGTAYTETTLDNNTARWGTALLLPGEGRVVINEVAWAGTAASTDDEWLELYNASPYPIDLAGWALTDGGDGPTGINIELSGAITAGGYFLLERTADDTVSDIPADQIYHGNLSNEGEPLTLSNALGQVVDTANATGGGWPAGTKDENRRTMERVDPLQPGDDANWASNDMVHHNGQDANQDPLNGTPKQLNSASYPPPPAADLALHKSGPLTVTPDSPIQYTLHISNVGTLPATAVRLTDSLPAGVTPLSSSRPFSQTAPGRLAWELGLVPTATQVQITLSGWVQETAAGTLTNVLSATTTASETEMINNAARCHTTVVVTGQARVLIEALLYHGYQSGEPDEAMRLVNVGSGPADLAGWRICDSGSGGSCAELPAIMLNPRQRIWLTGDAAAFAISFGYAPDYELASWPGYADDGDEAVLRDAANLPVDTVVYEDGDTDTPGWSGPALQPYSGSGNFAARGQILQRALDEDSGLPGADSNTRADWWQFPNDPAHGRRPLYPGWDLELFFWPLSLTEAASLTVAIAPDNAAEVLLEAIEGAQVSIEAEFYDLKHYGLVQALATRAQAGVDVVVLLEGEPAGGLADQELWACQELEAAGGQCWFMFNEDSLRLYDRYTFLHSKFMRIDGEWAILSSQNPTGGGLPDDDKSDGTWGSRGVLLLTDAPAVVDWLGAVFAADWDPAQHNDLTRWAEDNPHGYGAPPPGFEPLTRTGGTTSTVYFPTPLRISGEIGWELFSAPEAALRQSDALLGLLAQAGAGAAVDVEQMYEYRHWGLLEDSTPAPNLRLEAYIEAARRGARVRILLNSGAFGQDYFDPSDNLETIRYVNDIARREGLDLQARLGDPTDYGIHNKLVLVRLGEQGYSHIGSLNGSETSNKVNREVVVQVRSLEVYDYLEAMFEKDWYRSGQIYLPLLVKGGRGPAQHLLVSEVLYDVAGEDVGKEWVELYNPTGEAVDLSGWTLGDASVLGEYGSGRYAFPEGTAIPPQGLLTVAAQAEDVSGFVPDLEFLLDPARDDPGVPNMIAVDAWDGFGFALGNSGDKVILMDVSEQAVDVLAYGTGTYPGLIPHPGGVEAGHSLERRPPERDSDDCSADFFPRYPPTPGELP